MRADGDGRPRARFGRPTIVLRLDPRDRDALQMKLFLLLYTDQYAAVLVMTEAPNALPSDAGTDTGGDDYTFEKAYSFY